MSKCLYAIVGAAGCGRGLMPILREQLRGQGLPAEALVFVDDDPALQSTVINGQRVLSTEQFAAKQDSERHAVIGIANGKVREQLANQLTDAGVSFLHLQHSSVVRMDDVLIGDGACLSPFVTLTSNIRIGKHC